MVDNSNKIKIAEQNLATFRARLRSASDKDSIRRAIAATEQRIRELKAEQRGE